MHSRPRTYRLPVSQRLTTDVNEFLAVWDMLHIKAMAFFPGYVVGPFDPDIVLLKWGKNRWGEDIVEDRMTLSVQAVLALTPPTDEAIEAAKRRFRGQKP